MPKFIVRDNGGNSVIVEATEHGSAGDFVDFFDEKDGKKEFVYSIRTVLLHSVERLPEPVAV